MKFEISLQKNILKLHNLRGFPRNNAQKQCNFTVIGLKVSILLRLSFARVHGFYLDKWDLQTSESQSHLSLEIRNSKHSQSRKIRGISRKEGSI